MKITIISKIAKLTNSIKKRKTIVIYKTFTKFYNRLFFQIKTFSIELKKYQKQSLAYFNQNFNIFLINLKLKKCNLKIKRLLITSRILIYKIY